MKQNVLFKLFLIAALMHCNASMAQRDLVTPDMERCQILKGDTLIFRYKNLAESGEARVEYQNSYRSEDNDFTNLQNYVEGYMSPRYHWSPKGKKKHGGYVYHGDYTDAWDGFSKSSVKTNLKDIHSKPLVVIGTASRPLETSAGQYYAQEIILFNTAFIDTILYRWRTHCLNFEYSTKKCKEGICEYVYRPNTIYIPKHERMLRKKLLGKTFYIQLDENDKPDTSDKWVFDGENKPRKFRECTITDCKIWYEARYWEFSYLSPRMPRIEITYTDNAGNTTKYDNEYGKSKKTYSKADIDSLENKWTEEKRKAGAWVFKLKSVEKPQSQNVKKGKMDESGGYSDNIMTIVWSGNSKRLDFGIVNNTKSDIKIIWDDALMINPTGGTERVLHKNTIPAMLGTHQLPSTVIPGANLTDFFLTEYYDEGNRFRSDGTRWGVDYEGQTIKTLFPIELNGVKYRYTFTFELIWEWTYPGLHEDDEKPKK